jgi:hypothetical protein
MKRLSLVSFSICYIWDTVKPEDVVAGSPPGSARSTFEAPRDDNRHLRSFVVDCKAQLKQHHYARLSLFVYSRVEGPPLTVELVLDCRKAGQTGGSVARKWTTEGSETKSSLCLATYRHGLAIGLPFGFYLTRNGHY